MSRYRVFTVEVNEVELDVQLDTWPNFKQATAIFPVHDEVNLMPIMSADAIKQARELAEAMFWQQEPRLHVEETMDHLWRVG